MRYSVGGHCSPWYASMIVLMASLLLIPMNRAMAHRVTIFAWVEGDMVHTESKFSGGKQVKQAPVHVFDTQGNRLLSGRTDAAGHFSFLVPQQNALRIELEAGTGHRAEWILTAEEIRAAGKPPLTVTSAQSAPQMAPSAKRPAARSLPPFRSGLSARESDEIQRIVETALEQKMGPLRQQLTAIRRDNERLKFSEILGALGYILGLMGLAAFIHYRRLKG